MNPLIRKKASALGSNRSFMPFSLYRRPVLATNDERATLVVLAYRYRQMALNSLTTPLTSPTCPLAPVSTQ
jgi:hypothetical protein